MLLNNFSKTLKIERSFLYHPHISQKQCKHQIFNNTHGVHGIDLLSGHWCDYVVLCLMFTVV